MHHEAIYTLRSHGFSRIATHIELMWGSRELRGYLNNLTMDDRRNRNGFPPSVFNALHALARDISVVHPDESGCVWEDARG